MRRGENGAVAVMVALLAVTLLVMAGFITDFGQAYASKRQLQTAADSASLAAAAAYTNFPGNCATLMASTPARAAAQAQADAYLEENRSNAVGSPIQVSCSPAGALEVRVDVQGSTPAVFAPLTGGGDSISTSRTATAALDVASSIPSGLRPLAMCSAELPVAIDGNVVRVSSPGDGHKIFPGCPDTQAAGDWWTLDCPGERTGSVSLGLETQIRDGCPERVAIVEPQDVTSPATLSASLTSACPSAPVGSATCLSGDPGQLDSGQIEDAWRYLIDNRINVVLPVFCVPPGCVPTSLTGIGTNAVFPVYRLASMQVCGYHFGKTVRYNRFADECRNSGIHSATSDVSKDNYLLVVLTRVQVSGGTDDTTCGLGDPCDGGLRRVRLVE